MGERRVTQEQLFYGFSLERHVPADHLPRKIDRFVDLSEVRAHLEPFFSETGRPSVDPELMMRMLIVGYCFGVRSERRMCEEVHLNLAYRWFCRLGLDGDVPDHSTFSKNRHGRFRESDLFRKLFETVVARSTKERRVGARAAVATVAGTGHQGCSGNLRLSCVRKSDRTLASGWPSHDAGSRRSRCRRKTRECLRHAHAVERRHSQVRSKRPGNGRSRPR